MTHLEAERRIHSALDDDAKHLDLYGLRLTFVPESLHQLASLQTLNLGSNPLTFVPSWLGQLACLQELNLSGNLLTLVPEWLGQLASLQTLYLGGSRLTSVPESLGQLASLEALSLQGNQLMSVPKSLGQLASLQKLNLNGNRLASLPESLGQLVNLRSLDLGDNRLTSVPESAGQLTSLQELDVGSNRLTSVPESVGQLASLQTLNLRDNQLESVPESVGQLASLQELNVGSNRLTSVPKSVGQLVNLRSLDLGDNRLTSVPESVGQLTSLQELDVGSNRLTSVPESVGQLASLQTLNLSDNLLESVPESIGQLTSLQELEIGSNRLTSVPESVGQLTSLQALNLGSNALTSVPESLGQLASLQTLYLGVNRLKSVPESLGQLTSLQGLYLSGNVLVSVPESLGQLTSLQTLYLGGNQLESVPESLGQLASLQELSLRENQLQSVPESLGQLASLQTLSLDYNQLHTELQAASEEGLETLLAFLRARGAETEELFEAKLILVGEGEVGKSCLLDALGGLPWRERESTHGIRIETIELISDESKQEITLNGWDFGGQKVYRPTHQLFFSAPAVYLVVWKPREGAQAGQVKEWIRLVKHREQDAKILVVATHGGPGERLPDIDRHEIVQQFGEETVLGFFSVESKPDDGASGQRRGVPELCGKITEVALSLPEMGRKIPRIWRTIRQTYSGADQSWMTLAAFIDFCAAHGLDVEQTELFTVLSHRLGHLVHYANDPQLRDIVILQPDWLAKAISYVLDDPVTRANNGLVTFERLQERWDDPARDEDRYPPELHAPFRRLMERFDLSYRVPGSPLGGPENETSLVAQLVPDTTPVEALAREWPEEPGSGDEQQVQICRIVDEQGQSAVAEGLFFQLIVRLHKYSLGRVNYEESIHWKRGLVLDDEYNGRALLEHIGNDIRITVRAAYPVTFLAMLTGEVKFLVESFWEGLRCEVMVPCIAPCGMEKPGLGLFEVQKLIASKQKKRPDYPCDVTGCEVWQEIDCLLVNAASQQTAAPTEDERRMRATMTEVVRSEMKEKHRKDVHLFKNVRTELRAIRIDVRKAISESELQFRGLMETLTDEAKEGPRLFSFEPVKPGFFDKPKWMSQKFRLVLWCEHAKVPLPALNEDETRGVIELELPREWVKRAAPFLKRLSTTLGLVLPVASAATKLLMDDDAFERIEKQLDFGQTCAESFLEGTEAAADWMASGDAPDWERGGIRAEGAVLRELQVLLKEKDPGYGGLVRVQDKQHRFVWVHEQFVEEY